VIENSAKTIFHIPLQPFSGKGLNLSENCCVALVMLGNTPIIIDEPEAHLDSNLIAKYLVELVKTVKKNRQIIFATHNANFVINGDSELIHILTMSDSKVTNSCETSIENMDYREQLLSLEGGADAFRKREKKYFPQAVMG
tara:strand:+ start:391 stop:813 length:423 start_codon:yes stop_codon:yes gene_type:complete